MAIAFISDLHLRDSKSDIYQAFVNFLNHAPTRYQTLYVLGDLFDYWIGDDAAEHCGYSGVVDSLRRCVASGLSIKVMRGNRDFLLGAEFAKSSGVSIVDDPHVISQSGIRILLTHGDALCTDDISHQEFRKTTHNPVWQQAFLAKSLVQRLEIALEMRNQSKELGKDKTARMMDVNPHTAMNWLRKYQADHILHGHTHKLAIHEMTNDQIPPYRIVLGDWGENLSVAVWENSRLTLREETINQTSRYAENSIKLR